MKHFAATINKTLLFLFLSVFVFSSSTCAKRCTEDDVASYNYVLGLELQTLFINDHVQLVVDGTVCCNEVVSTNLTNAYAGGIRQNAEVGKHSMQIFVNEHLKLSEQLIINRNQYAGIHFDRTAHQQELNFSETPFVYD
jgi:hypothetical protein